MAISDDTKYSLTGAEIKTLASKVNEKAAASSVYTKTEIDSKLTSAMTYKGTVAAVTDLPQSGNKKGDVYNVTATGDNYAWDGSAWDQLSGVVDLSNYYTKTETDTELDTKVDKVSGKGLSEEDFTTAEKTKLSGIESGAEANTIESISVNGTQQTITNKNVDLTIEGGIKTLTTDDYNYPANNPTKLDLGTLAPGVYVVTPEDTSINPEYNVYYNGKNAQVGGGGKLLIKICKGGSGKMCIASSQVGDNAILLDGQKNYQVPIVLSVADVVDNLVNTNTRAPLSANQGKVLNERIGNLSSLTTTAKTSTVAAINELDSELDNAKPLSGSTAPTTSTAGTLGQTYVDTSTGDIYYLSEIDETTDPDTYTWEKLSTGTGVNVVQTTGTSTADVMSQNAVTSMVFADPSTKKQVQIGSGATGSGAETVAIGDASRASGRGALAIGGVSSGVPAEATALNSIAIGSGARATIQGEMNIGSSYAGYNNSAYRLLTGLYDPQTAHDAATKSYVDTSFQSTLINGGTTLPTSSTVGQVGTQYNCVNNGEPEIYICTAVDTSTTPNTYTWKKVGLTLQLSTTDPGEGSPLADNTLLGIYE